MQIRDTDSIVVANCHIINYPNFPREREFVKNIFTSNSESKWYKIKLLRDSCINIIDCDKISIKFDLSVRKNSVICVPIYGDNFNSDPGTEYCDALWTDWLRKKVKKRLAEKRIFDRFCKVFIGNKSFITKELLIIKPRSRDSK